MFKIDPVLEVFKHYHKALNKGKSYKLTHIRVRMIEKSLKRHNIVIILRAIDGLAADDWQGRPKYDDLKYAIDEIRGEDNVLKWASMSPGKECVMEDQTSTALMSEYDEDAIWRQTFLNYGIEKNHINCWFGNFTCKLQWQKTILAKIKTHCRRNAFFALIGEEGTGKTHLATAILKDAIICRHRKKGVLEPGHYYSMKGVKNKEQFLTNIVNSACLVIDDIQSGDRTFFEELIDRRANVQTVFVGTLTGLAFKQLMGNTLLARMEEQGLETAIFSDRRYRYA